MTAAILEAWGFQQCSSFFIGVGKIPLNPLSPLTLLFCFNPTGLKFLKGAGARPGIACNLSPAGQQDRRTVQCGSQDFQEIYYG